MKLETVKKTFCTFKCLKTSKDGQIVTNARNSVLFADLHLLRDAKALDVRLFR